NSNQILAAAGLSYDDIDEELKSYSDSADAFKDGLIDAMFVTSGIPNASVTDIALTKGVKVLSIDDAVIAKLQQDYPFYIDAVVPKDAYKGQSEDVKTVAVLASLTVNSSLSKDFVYDLTKTLFENLDTLGTKHAKGKEITLENALKGLTIPIHPGAQKYYDEKGITK
ncbi:MAG: TAXI family TRAP transporter solute-binding subunit, partial [Bacilli bacterium]